MKNSSCMICNSSKLEKIIDLGIQPNGNYFPTYKELNSELKYPLAMSVCTDCWLVQIDDFPPVEQMFSNHPYITGVNMPVLSHFDTLVEDVCKKYELKPKSLVIDIGANDGTLLSKFRDRGMRVLGVDPGKRTGVLAKENGITVCKAFWNESTAIALKQLGLIPDLITATAVFYHVDDLHSFVKGLSQVMDNETLFLTQCVYLKDVIEKIQFDHFYHEHLMIHAVSPLEKLFSEYGLRMLDIDFYPIHGGSFVLYVGREESPYKTSPTILETIEAEKASGLQNLEIYSEFRTKIDENRVDLLDLLQSLKNAGKSVFGLGAPLKGSTLLNYYNIGPDLVECVTEVNKFKIGRFTPGTNIPIVFEESVEKQPDYYLVLSWNYIDFFIEKYSDYLLEGGQFIVPHPKVKIIGKEILEH